MESNICNIQITDKGVVSLTYSPRFREIFNSFPEYQAGIPIDWSKVEFNNVYEYIAYSLDGSEPVIDKTLEHNYWYHGTNNVSFPNKISYMWYGDRPDPTKITLDSNQTIKFKSKIDVDNKVSETTTIQHHNNDLVLASISKTYDSTSKKITFKKGWGSGSLYYTTDGSDPVTNGTWVNDTIGKIELDNTNVVRVCIKYGNRHTDVVNYKEGDIISEEELKDLVQPDIYYFKQKVGNDYVEVKDWIVIENKNKYKGQTLGKIYYTLDGTDPDENSIEAEYNKDNDSVSIINVSWTSFTAKAVIIHNDKKSPIATKIFGSGIRIDIKEPTFVWNSETKKFKVTSETPNGKLYILQSTQEILYGSYGYEIEYNKEYGLNYLAPPKGFITAKYEYQIKSIKFNVDDVEILNTPTVVIQDNKIKIVTNQQTSIKYAINTKTITGEFVDYKEPIPVEDITSIQTYCYNTYYNSKILKKDINNIPKKAPTINLIGTEDAELKTNTFKPYIDLVCNEGYDIPKVLNNINYILNKVINNTPMSNFAEELFAQDYSGDYLLIYSDSTYTGLIDIKTPNDKPTNAMESFKLPHRDKGVWNFNYFRNNITTQVTEEELSKEIVVPYYNPDTRRTEVKYITLDQIKELYKNNSKTNAYNQSDLRSLIYGKYFVARFVFDVQQGNIIKLETINFDIQKY